MDARERLVWHHPEDLAAAVDVRHDQLGARMTADGGEDGAAVVVGALAAGGHDVLDVHHLGGRAVLGGGALELGGGGGEEEEGCEGCEGFEAFVIDALRADSDVAFAASLRLLLGALLDDGDSEGGAVAAGARGDEGEAAATATATAAATTTATARVRPVGFALHNDLPKLRRLLCDGDAAVAATAAGGGAPPRRGRNAAVRARACVDVQSLAVARGVGTAHRAPGLRLVCAYFLGEVWCRGGRAHRGGDAVVVSRSIAADRA